MMRAIDLPAEALVIVNAVLRRHLPPSAKVWAFGSRVTGTARRYSDLDLALEAEQPLNWTVLADIAAEMSESDLPMKVDVVDLRAIEPSFRQSIESTMVALPPA